MSSDLLTYILPSLVALLLLWIIRLELRLTRLLAGKDAKTLEDTIVRLREEITELYLHKKGNEVKFDKLDHKLARSVQWVETLRYNPYQDQGGKHSWSTLLADERGNGVVITGLWSREKNNVYAKPVQAYKSEHELSTEELELISRVKQ